MAEETVATEKITPEIVANPEFISWKYPPYCELCNVNFTGEDPAKLHFDGKNHKNRLHTWRKYQDPDAVKNTKNVLCNVCYKDMNTQAMLDIHRTSPAHQKEEKGRVIVQKLKEDYMQLKASQQTK